MEMHLSNVASKMTIFFLIKSQVIVEKAGWFYKLIAHFESKK